MAVVQITPIAPGRKKLPKKFDLESSFARATHKSKRTMPKPKGQTFLTRKEYVRRKKLVLSQDNKGLSPARIALLQEGRTLYDIYFETDKNIAIISEDEIIVDLFRPIMVKDKDAPYQIDVEAVELADVLFKVEMPSSMNASFEHATYEQYTLVFYENENELLLYDLPIRHCIETVDRGISEISNSVT